MDAARAANSDAACRLRRRVGRKAGAQFVMVKSELRKSVVGGEKQWLREYTVSTLLKSREKPADCRELGLRG